MATNLSKLLSTEAHRGKGRHGKGGKLVEGVAIEIPVDPALEPFCVSSSRTKGKYYFVRAFGSVVRVGMVRASMDAEDELMGDAVSSIYEYGGQLGWPNTIPAAEFASEKEAFDEAMDYLGFFFDDPGGLQTVQSIFMSTESLRTLIKTGEFHAPKSGKPITKMMSGYKSMVENGDALARFREKIPVYVNDHLKKLVVFAPKREYVGTLTRVSNHGAAVLFHNLQRGLFILKVD